MTDDLQPSEQTADRIATRTRIGLSLFVVTCATGLARSRLSGSSVSVSFLQVGMMVGAGVALGLLGNRYYRSVDRRIAESETAALFAGRANIYIDQILAAPETSSSARRARAGWMRLLTQGQGLLEGTLRLDADGIYWAPARLARRFGMEELRIPLHEIGSVEVSRIALRLGRGGTATLHLRSGFPIDLQLPDRERFAAAWMQAPGPGRPNPARQ